MPSRCLETPQILRLIVSMVGSPKDARPHLASLALTCRVISQIATEYLWEELDSLGPLLNAIGSDLWYIKASSKRSHSGPVKVSPSPFTLKTMTDKLVRTVFEEGIYSSGLGRAQK